MNQEYYDYLERQEQDAHLAQVTRHINPRECYACGTDFGLIWSETAPQTGNYYIDDVVGTYWTPCPVCRQWHGKDRYDRFVMTEVKEKDRK